MTAFGQPGRDWTVVLRRRPARVVAGRAEGGYTDLFEIIWNPPASSGGSAVTGYRVRALRFGNAKINLHQAGQEFELKAARPVPGSADLCLISSDSLPAVCTQLAAHGVAIEECPVARTGAIGANSSVYIRDPDGNLIEISNYLAGEPAKA